MMWSLQDFLLPSLFLSDADQTTAAQAVMRFKEALGTTPSGIGRYNASLVLLAVPALVAYRHYQRKVIDLAVNMEAQCSLLVQALIGPHAASGAVSEAYTAHDEFPVLQTGDHQP